MSAIENNSAVGMKPVEFSPYLAGWWPCFNLTGTSIEDASGNGNTLSQFSGTLLSSIASIKPGRLRWGATSGILALSDLTKLELTRSNRHIILCARVKLDTIDATSGYLIGKHQYTGRYGTMLNIAANGTPQFSIGDGAGNLSSRSCAALLANTEYHIAGVLDRYNNVWKVFKNGVDATVGSTAIPTVTEASAENFMIGAMGHTGSLQGAMSSITGNADAWDFQLYIKDSATSGLPANYAALIAWMYRHPYQPVPASMWE